MRNADHKVLHLAHPTPVSWASVFSAAADDLRIPLVPFSEWFDKLSRTADSLDTNSAVSLAERSPAIRILDFFRASSVYGNKQKGREAMGLRRFDLSFAINSSSSLKKEKISSLSGESARLWISYWKSIGWGL